MAYVLYAVPFWYSILSLSEPMIGMGCIKLEKADEMCRFHLRSQKKGNWTLMKKVWCQQLIYGNFIRLNQLDIGIIIFSK